MKRVNDEVEIDGEIKTVKSVTTIFPHKNNVIIKGSKPIINIEYYDI